MTQSISDFIQPDKFKELANKMLCNIGIFQADSITLEFLKTYVPFLATKPKPGGGWIVRGGSEFRHHNMRCIRFISINTLLLILSLTKRDLIFIHRKEIIKQWVWVIIVFGFSSKINRTQKTDLISIYKMFDSVSTTKIIVEKDTKKIASFETVKVYWPNEGSICIDKRRTV